MRRRGEISKDRNRKDGKEEVEGEGGRRRREEEGLEGKAGKGRGKGEQ